MAPQFEGFDDAVPVEQGVNPLGGVYPVVQIEGFFHHDSQRNPGKEVFGIKLLIIRSNVAGRPAGTFMSVTRKEGDYGPKAFWGQVKPILAPIFGITADAMKTDDLKKALSPENPYRGQRFRLVAIEEPQKKDPSKSFCQVTFGPVLSEEDERKMFGVPTVQAVLETSSKVTPVNGEPEGALEA